MQVTVSLVSTLQSFMDLLGDIRPLWLRKEGKSSDRKVLKLSPEDGSLESRLLISNI